eukprot:GGOE01061764.1.p1 GENE.GGOE01061764.1~~GGOE01061764.1.p1  ORF type:complete len:293 (+),score=20.56 GGOE01061764.1:475-1353(+)
MVILNNSYLRETSSDEGIASASPILPFDCNLLSKLKNKYGQWNHREQILLISFGADRFRFALSHQCHSVPGSRGTLVIEEAICGEVNFKSCSCEGSRDAKEELVSKLKSKVERPHGVLVGEKNVDWAIQMCNEWGVPVFKLDGQPIRLASQISAEIKAQLIEERMMGDCWEFARSHHNGFCAGRREFEKVHEPEVILAKASGATKGKADARFLSQLNLLEATFPLSLCDKYTQKPMKDPVVTKTGMTYERVSIMPFLLDTGKEPGTILPLKPEELIPNRLYKDLLRCVGVTK